MLYPVSPDGRIEVTIERFQRGGHAAGESRGPVTVTIVMHGTLRRFLPEGAARAVLHLRDGATLGEVLTALGAETPSTTRGWSRATRPSPSVTWCWRRATWSTASSRSRAGSALSQECADHAPGAGRRGPSPTGHTLSRDPLRHSYGATRSIGWRFGDPAEATVPRGGPPGPARRRSQ